MLKTGLKRDTLLGRVEDSVRFTRMERLASVVGLFAIAATLAANLF